MTQPTVDVVIPVHSGQRPIARATASILATATIETRVSVVCHNVATEEIAAALGHWADNHRVRLLHLNDGIMSAAGPLNVGLDAATGEFTAILGSDDEYEPGAINAWVSVARRDDADVVIPPLRKARGTTTLSPPVRPFRRRKLDGVRDRLSYRTAQLGLVSRRRFGHVRMTEGLRTGEDVIQGATLWYSDARISLARGRPGYIIHEDDPANRVSSSAKPAAESLLFLDAVLAREFVVTLTEAQREAFAVKLLRTHIMDILGASLRSGAPAADLAELAEGVRRIVALAPSAIGILSRREARIIRELATAGEPSLLAAQHAVLTDFRRVGNILPSSGLQLFHREAPPRFLAAIALMR